jgi:hypothetical protein
MSRHGVILCPFLAGLLGGCRTAIDPIAIQDAQVAAQIKTALVNDPELGATRNDVLTRAARPQ